MLIRFFEAVSESTGSGERSWIWADVETAETKIKVESVRKIFGDFGQWVLLKIVFLAFRL
jgi:hypothetical protein